MGVGLNPVAGRPLLKAALVVAVGLALIWVSMGVTFTLALGKYGPEQALGWWPWGAAPKAALANEIAARQDATPADLSRAETLARAALMREPVNLVAARTLGLIAAKRNDLAKAERYFAYAENLSRRDLTTQLWMIEKSVRENDIPRTLRHYDRALRTSRRAPDLLFPTLVAASNDPAIVEPLATLLASRPEWWHDFLGAAVRNIDDPRSLMTFSRALKLDMRASPDQIYVRQIVERLVKDRLYADAVRYYGEVRGGSSQPLVRDGNFDHDIALLPLDWWFRNDSELSAMREMFGDGDFRLVLRASGGRGGEVARQLLVLAPGRHTLSGKYGAVEGDGGGSAPLVVEVTCLDRPALVRSQLAPPDIEGEDFSVTFTVPDAKCPAQWVRFVAAPLANTDLWIDRIELRRN